MALPGYNLKLFRDKDGNPIPFSNLTHAQQREIGYGPGLRKGLHLTRNHRNIGASFDAIRRMFSEKMRSGRVRDILPYADTDELNEIGKAVLHHGSKDKFQSTNDLVNAIPSEYEHLYNQATTGVPSDDISEIIDELSGFKIITTKDIHGNIVSQKRVAIPLSGAEKQRRDSLLSTINSTMTRMNTLLRDDPEFHIDEPLQQFATFVNNINNENTELFNRLFANAGIHNFKQDITDFKNNYVSKFEDEMRIVKEKGAEELLNKGYGEQSTAYSDYMSRMDANLARGKTDIARDSQVYGERLLDNQLQRDTGLYGAQLEKNKFNINAQSQALDRTLQGKRAKLDKRFDELKALESIYGTSVNDYNTIMNRFNQSQQTLGDYLLNNRANYDKLSMHAAEMDDARARNETQRYGIDKQYDAALKQIELQKYLERKSRVSSFKTGLGALGLKTAGAFVGKKLGLSS